MGLYPAIDMSQAILSLVFGGLIGFSLGLLGGGGSILTVPILVYVIGQDVHAATGTSLAIVGANALLGALAHSRKGNVRMKSGLIFGLMSMIGAIPGVWLNNLVEGKVILILFGFLMLAVAISMLHKKIGHPGPKDAGMPYEAYTPKDWFSLLLMGLVVGFLTGFFGVGGGFLIVPAIGVSGKFPNPSGRRNFAVGHCNGLSLGLFGASQFRGCRPWDCGALCSWWSAWCSFWHGTGWQDARAETCKSVWLVHNPCGLVPNL